MRAGFLSVGVSAYALPAARRAPLVIAQANAPDAPHAGQRRSSTDPRSTAGSRWTSRCSPTRRRRSGTSSGASRGTSPRLIPDGATIQAGIGAIPQAIMEALGDRRDLGVHSLFVEHMLPLVERG